MRFLVLLYIWEVQKLKKFLLFSCSETNLIDGDEMKKNLLVMFTVALFINGCTPNVEPKIEQFTYKSGSFEISGVKMKLNDTLIGDVFSDTLTISDTTSTIKSSNDTIVLRNIKSIYSSEEQGGFTYVTQDLITIAFKILIDFDNLSIRFFEIDYRLDHMRAAMQFSLTQWQTKTYKVQLIDLPVQIASDGLVLANFIPFSDMAKIKSFYYSNSYAYRLGYEGGSSQTNYNAVHSLLPEAKLKITLKPD